MHSLWGYGLGLLRPGHSALIHFHGTITKGAKPGKESFYFRLPQNVFFWSGRFGRYNPLIQT